MQFSHHVLDNGLQVVVEKNPAARTLSVGFFVNTGARDESPEIAGVSHFLEHMLFKGSEQRTAEEVNQEFDQLGAHYNAYTGEEHTEYFASLLPEQQEPVVALLCDIMRPALRGEDFLVEKQVILEEIQMYADLPPYGGDEKIRAEFFAGHPLAASVLGTLSSVGNLQADQMRAYCEARYCPNNLIFAAAGNVQVDALVRQLDKLTRTWQPGAAGRKVIPARGNAGQAEQLVPQATQQYVLQMCNGPAAEEFDRHAAKLASLIIGDDSGSRLYWQLVDTGLAEHASLSHHEFQGGGFFLTSLSCMPEDAAECLHQLERTYHTVQAQGLTPDEFERVRRRTTSRVCLSGEKSSSRLFSVALDWLQRQEYQSVQDDLRLLQSLTLDDVHRVLERYPLKHAFTLGIGPSSFQPAGKLLVTARPN